MQHWLMKSEPTVYSIDDLERDKVTSWEGVRNYQARNFMRDDMQIGDLVLFYHSNASPPGVAGIGKIVREAYPDNFAFKKDHKYYDSRSTSEKPLWFMVDVGFVGKFKNLVSLDQIKNEKALEGIMVAKKGSRLSVQPISEAHFKHICKMADYK